jgi:inosine-5'-monophosphate dehydrogenase
LGNKLKYIVTRRVILKNKRNLMHTVQKEVTLMKPIPLKLSYDDVLLVPKKSIVFSRKDISTKTKFSRRIDLNIPIVSANMDSVTESDMAIAMARLGGIGIIHRFMGAIEQAEEVEKVKRADNLLIEKPYMIAPNRTLADVKKMMNEKGIHGLLVVENNQLQGIITDRDVIFRNNDTALVSELMTPFPKLYTGWEGISVDEAKDIFKISKIEKLPIINDNKELKGLITQKDIIKVEKYPMAARDRKGRLLVGAAIGVKSDFLDRTKALVDAGVDVIVIDVAHGHSIRVIDVLQKVKKHFPDIDVIAGNVASAEATKDLIENGADGIKVGVGPGCFAAGTRILMANGVYKNIEDINPREKIINKDGMPVKVKKSFCTGIRKVSKLRNSIFYQDTFVTPDHKFWVGDLNTSSRKTLASRGYAYLLNQKSKTIPKKSKYKWKKVKDFKQDALLMPKKINFEFEETFEVKLKKRVKGNWRIGYTYATDVILKPCYELGYIFGTFLGDGSSHTAVHKGSHIGSVRWYFGKNEKRIANKLNKCLFKVFSKEAKIQIKSNIIQQILYYKPFADFLQKFGKKEKKHLPDKYLINNRKYLQGILDGLVDSDGYKEPQGRTRFCNTSKRLIELFNITSYLLTGVFPNNLKKGINVGGLNYKDVNCFNPAYLSEIINTGKKRLTKDYQAIKLLEIQETEMKVEVYDLEVDCPTHSFIANNAIAHNSICTTRIVSGSGVPQCSAVMDCAEIARDLGVPIIADGGVKVSGDISKAIAAGASTVMIGSLLAGTDESPGLMTIRNGEKFKVSRGMASFGAAMGRRNREKQKLSKDLEDVVPEGVEAVVRYKGKVAEVVAQLVGGLRSGMSYCGADSVPMMHEKSEFVRISGAGMRESKPHDVNLV